MKLLQNRALLVALVIVLPLSSMDRAAAALPPEVKKQLTEMSRELRGVSSMVRKKEVDEAKTLIADVEEKLGALEIAEDERDRTYKLLLSSLDRAKKQIPVSFEHEVAPIIKEKCEGCHNGNRAGNNLRLDTYAAMGRGGRSGPLLIPRNPQRSLMLARIAVDGPGRMPKGGDKLSEREADILFRWIAGGAAFDGENMQDPIGQSTVPKKPEIKVVMADGSESVSFKDDVAPWMVNVCMGCHSGNNARGGYNMTTFKQLLEGGETGSTIVPGDPDSSYIVDLVLRQDPIKMPAGNQTRIKRSQAVALETWIKEGAHFDGGDPNATLRSMVPTAEELEAARLATMSDADFTKRRLEQAETLWKQVAPREEATSADFDNLFVYGNAPQSRLDQIGEWAEAQVADLSSKYKLPGGEKPWRGKLVVFVSKTRFDYEEFNTVLMNRRTPRGVNGHSHVTPNFDQAYVTLFDVGDDESEDSLNTQQLVAALVAEAFIGRDGQALPDWLQQGFGLLQSGATSNSKYFGLLPQRAAESLATVTNPATIFDNGTFAPEEVGPVGFLLTRFLLNRGGAGKLRQLIPAIRTSRNAGRAVQAVYGQSAAAIATEFLRTGGR